MKIPKLDDYGNEERDENGCVVMVKATKYELVYAKDVFDDDNNGLPYGINWLDNNGNVVDCEWFSSDIERLKAYALEVHK